MYLFLFNFISLAERHEPFKAMNEAKTGHARLSPSKLSDVWLAG